MKRIHLSRVTQRLLMLAFLLGCFWMVTSTDLTPKASAAFLCCYCDNMKAECIAACNGNPTCENDCRWNNPTINYCYAHCVGGGGYCDSDENCSVGGRCVNHTCLCE